MSTLMKFESNYTFAYFLLFLACTFILICCRIVVPYFPVYSHAKWSVHPRVLHKCSVAE